MVPRRDHRRQSDHQDDHIRHKDENFQYQGTLPTELFQKFHSNENHPQIMFLQGFLACGKTRTSKEFARIMARKHREQKGGLKEVHTFLFDLKNKSVESLLRNIHKVLKDKLPNWESHGNIENVGQLIAAFGDEKKSHDRVFILVLDNVDRAHDNKQNEILEFIQELVSCVDNVYMVLTSGTDINLIRIRSKIMKHQMEPMKLEDAKELLKETSGNPEDLDKYADEIIGLVSRSPLALMIAGNEMNSEYTELAYTPKEFVGVMTNSVSLSLDLENAPTSDRIIQRIIDIVKSNITVLEKIVIALDCPQMFDTDSLEDAIAAVSGHMYEGQIKQTILRVVLRRSLYGLNGKSDSGVSLESAPLLIEVLKETFCQMTSKDGFLKEFNKNLVNTLDDKRLLMSLGAKELRRAEILLLRNQKDPKVTAQGLQELRANVIRKAYDFLVSIEVDKKACKEFHDQCIQIQNAWEREVPKVTVRNGIQETCAGQQEQPVIFCRSPPRMIPESQEKELEACVSLTTSSDIALPGFKDISQVNATAKSPATESENDSTSEEAKRAIGNYPQKGGNGDIEHSGSEKKRTDDTASSSKDNTSLQGQPVIPDSTYNDKLTVTVKSSKLDINVNQDENMTIVSQSPLSQCTKSDPLNVFTVESSIPRDLCKTFDKSMSLSAPSLYGSLHSNDCRDPTQESLPSHITFSALPTLPDNHVLTSPSNLQNRKVDDRQHQLKASTEMSMREAVESEFDWEPEDNNELVESTEETNSDQKTCGAVIQAEGNKDHPVDKIKHEVMMPQQLTLDRTTATTTTITTTKGTVTDSPCIWQQSHPKYGRNKTRGQGILGSSPSSSSSFHFPANSQGPVPHQNTSLTPMDRGYPSNRRSYFGDLHIRGQSQIMLPGPFQAQHIQDGSYHNPPYNEESVPYNQFEREYNEVYFQSSCFNYSGDMPTNQDFTKASDRFSQAHGSPLHTSVLSPTSSFHPQGPSNGYSQPHGPPIQSHVPTFPPNFHMQSPSDRFSLARGPPLHSSISSPSSSFQPQGPSYGYRQPHRPPFQSRVSPPPSSFQLQSPSIRPIQAGGPPFESYVSSPSPSFRPQGPPTSSTFSPPHSLRTNGFYAPPGNGNGPQSHSNQRDYGHYSTSDHQHRQYQQQPHYGLQRNSRY